MLGQIGQLTKLLANAGKIKEDMQRMQERLKAARYVGEAGGGQVTATCDGRCELVALKIAPELVAAGDVEMLEDLVCAAVRDAGARSREGAQHEMNTMAGELGLPSVGNLLNP